MLHWPSSRVYLSVERISHLVYSSSTTVRWCDYQFPLQANHIMILFGFKIISHFVEVLYTSFNLFSRVMKATFKLEPLVYHSNFDATPSRSFCLSQSSCARNCWPWWSCLNHPLIGLQLAKLFAWQLPHVWNIYGYWWYQKEWPGQHKLNKWESTCM